MSKKKAVTFIEGLVVLTSKIADSDEPSKVGLSFKPANGDEQQIQMDVLVLDKVAETLQVDKIYLARFLKKPYGKVETFGGMKINFLNEVDFGTHYEEKMVLAPCKLEEGELQGHIVMDIKTDQETFFYEKKKYYLELEEFVEDGEEATAVALTETAPTEA